MSRLWGNVWLRSLTTLIYALAIQAPIPLALHAIILAEARQGGLDFAGGSIIHVSAWAAIMALLPFWAAAEIVARRRRTSPPIGAYLTFVPLFYMSLTIVTLFAVQYLISHAHGKASSGLTMAASIVATWTAASVTGLVPALLFYRLYRRPKHLRIRRTDSLTPPTS